MGTFSCTQFLIYSCGLKVVIVLLLFGCIYPAGGDQAVFYDERNYDGNSLTLNISGGCYKMKRKWVGRTSSMQVDRDACMVAWKNDDCTGQSITVHPNSKESYDLGDVGFDNKIRSISLCHEISFRPIFVGVGERMGNSAEVDVESSRQKAEVNFYDEPEFGGSVFTLTLYADGECYNFNSKWASKITSMEIQDNCLKVWDKAECEGPFIRLNSANTSPEEFRNLKRIRLDNRIKSVKLCNQPKASRPPKTDDDSGSRMGDSGSGFRRGGATDRPTRPPKQNIPQGAISSDQDVMELALREHNKYRRMHGVPELRWDESMQRTAQSYANYLASNNKFEHSKDNFDLGENLAGTSTEGKLEALNEAIGLWYHEITHYNFDNPSRSVMGIKAGHFTQMVWKSTTDFGIGMAWNPKRMWWVIVANYSPAGNFKGEYAANVFPPMRS